MTKQRAFWMGVKDGWKQGQLCYGLTWANRDDLNEAYDRGANIGERVARLFGWAR